MPKKINKCGFGLDFDKLGSYVYAGTAEFGKDYIIITTIITLIICVFFIIGGIFMIIRKPEYTKQTKMKIEKFTTLTDQNGKTKYNYFGKVDECKDNLLNLVGDEYSILKVGETVPVFIKPNGSCQEARLHTDNFKPIGIFFIILALIVAAFSLLNLFFVRKYKGIAAIEGISAGFNLFRR